MRQKKSKKKIRITLIGGGHGPFHIIKALMLLITKDFPGIVITCICPNSDGGGSTGELAKEGGHRSIGDVSSCIAALTKDELIADKLQDRRENGLFTGHSRKNLIAWALQGVFGIYEAIATLSRLCEIAPHQVLPVASESLTLKVRTYNGKKLSGEKEIDGIASNPLFVAKTHRFRTAWLDPAVKAKACPLVIKVIKESDFIIICPGSFWTSIMAILLVEGVKEAIMESKAKLIMITNLITQAGDTHGLTVKGFIKKIEPALGRQLDYVVANRGSLSESDWMKELIKEAGISASVSKNGKLTKLGRTGKDSRVITANILSASAERGFHHDPEKTAEVLRKIIADNI